MTRADLKHCGKIPDAREELNRSVREGRIESRHSIKSLEGMGSSFQIKSNQIKLYFPTYINTNMLHMMKYTYWKKGWKFT